MIYSKKDLQSKHAGPRNPRPRKELHMATISREQRLQAEARRAPALTALRARGQRPEAALQKPEAGGPAKTARPCKG